MAKVILNTPITTDRYGLHFEKGEAHTNNEYLINKLIRKGVKVEIQEEQPEVQKEKTIDEMTVAELKEYATKNKIEIPSTVKAKADILDFLKNYKEDPGEDKKEDLKENSEKNNNEDTGDNAGDSSQKSEPEGNNNENK